MDAGHLSSLALMLSGAAGIAIPGRVSDALDLTAGTARGVAETRAGLGGTYAALGAFALLSESAGAQRAVGATWLGAGVVRIASLRIDRPRTDGAYWAYLVAELGLGTAALVAARKRL
ncbi:hypothetical protein EFK50_20660 [Nocardioides marmoriginsengisoli]|uniref:DUF4345 domain-containing protein n=1 Tax=Nocardioides marmoriginsengisoli TaxID=661483 RepID=A0A3N0CB97_9ACTN|nr:hypothetical protein [Nocardioides marmoriginsengisoli]RNL60720.1 hypothetical protein EFK50_20660 [Nocardioides marmoriginsengisoli]